MDCETTHSQNSAVVRRGVIISFTASWSSGLAMLTILRTDAGHNLLDQVPCDNAPTARALIAAFGCGRPGHVIDNNAICGKRIRYALDRHGVLGVFEPVESEEA